MKTKITFYGFGGEVLGSWVEFKTHFYLDLEQYPIGALEDEVWWRVEISSEESISREL